jgi:hypothetical protein
VPVVGEEWLLPRRHAEAGRVGLYHGYFYFTGIAAVLRELRSALAARKKKKTAVAGGSRSTACGVGPKASSQLAGKRKANELLSSGD